MLTAYIRPYNDELSTVEEELGADNVVSATCVWDLDETTRNEVEILSVFVDYEVTTDVLDMLPNLKMIAARSTGYDHINVAEAQQRGIVVSRVPHYGARTVAEYAVSLMFALSRKAYRSYIDLQRDAGISGVDAYEGFDLYGKTLGVIGTGSIGRNVCELAKGIGMNVVAYDVSPDEAFAANLGMHYSSLDEVLAQSDILTLHVPSIPDTHHLINKEKLQKMKVGSYLINTARGEIVDTKALVHSLQQGHLAGAGLDVLEGEHELREEAELRVEGTADPALWETLVADHALIDMQNVIVTPHIAFNTIEAKHEITQTTLENIKTFASGSPQHTVTL
jgi:D-lactate dehydrogenase